MENFNKFRTLVYVLAGLVAIWGILGLMDSKNYTYSGFQTDGDKTVIKIEEGSPAEAAGMQVGDFMVSVDGTGWDDSKAWDKKPRPEIGETRTFLITRDGEEVSLDLTYAAQSGKNKTLNLIGFVVGLIFLLCGMWIFLSSRSKSAFLFTLFAVSFGMVFLNGPYFTSPVVREISNYVGLVFILSGFTMLVYFLLQFPDPRPILDKKNAKWRIVGPALIVAIVILILNIFDPDATSGLRMAIRLMFGLMVLYYFGWALITLFRRYRENSAEDRASKGLNLMLVGAILGLVPLLVIIIIDSIAPATLIPGDDYAFLLLGLIPITFALAIRKYESAVA